MPRKKRLWFPGAKYHITTRGNRRSAIFFDTEDFKQYLFLLLETKRKFPFNLHAYCLMTNHTHLQMETSNVHIASIMKHLNMKYAQYINTKYKLSGHLFEGRYKASLILDLVYEIDASKYIHLNPVAAKIVHNPEDYQWSSYRAYLYKRHNDSLVTTDHILSYFSNHHQESYPSYVLTPNTKIHFTSDRKVKFSILKK